MKKENKEGKKVVAPHHWKEITILQPYFTIVRPFYQEHTKEFIVKVLNEKSELIEHHVFINKECAYKKFEELKTEYKLK